MHALQPVTGNQHLDEAERVSWVPWVWQCHGNHGNWAIAVHIKEITRINTVKKETWGLGRGQMREDLKSTLLKVKHNQCCLVLSDSLQPHGLQHTSLPCPSLSPGVCSDECPLSRWCHPTISSFLLFSFFLFFFSFFFSSCSQSFPASGSFLVSQLFTSGGQSIGASALASVSVLPVNIQ